MLVWEAKWYINCVLHLVRYCLLFIHIEHCVFNITYICILSPINLSLWVSCSNPDRNLKRSRKTFSSPIVNNTKLWSPWYSCLLPHTPFLNPQNLLLYYDETATDRKVRLTLQCNRENVEKCNLFLPEKLYDFNFINCEFLMK